MSRRTHDKMELSNEELVIEYAKMGRVDDLESLLKSGAVKDLEQKDEGGFTALQLAVFYGHEKAVRLLVENGADINIVDKTGRSVFHLATKKGHTNIMEYLLEVEHKFLNREDINKESAIFCAAEYGQVLAAELLFHRGAYLEARNIEGNLFYAVARDSGNGEIAELLLEKSLMRAARNGSREGIEFVIENGVDVMYSHDEDGNSALHLAALGDHGETIQFLARAGAILDAGNKECETALILAARDGKLQAVEALIEVGAGLDYGDGNKGRTALHWAADGGHEEVYEMLKDAGARTDFEDVDNKAADELLFEARDRRDREARLVTRPVSPGVYTKLYVPIKNKQIDSNGQR